MSKRVCFFLVIIILAGNSCRQQYDPEVESLQKAFLVVEGNLNAGTDSTIIRLTRTVGLHDTMKVRAENNAILTVEGKDNTTRTLIERGGGYYVFSNLNLAIGTEYRLRIKTQNSKEYLSDYVKARAVPPIDSINSEIIDKKVWVYANTHDPSGLSKYYRWDFDETWEIRSSFYSTYVYDNGVRPRNLPAEEVYYCWKYDSSKSILLANSTGLQDDIIHRAVLTTIPVNNERVSVRYSIQVRQYVLDKEAYDFFELMKRNTEQIGGIFTPQPSELRGNIHSVDDPSEYVLGYVTASAVQKARIFITIPNPEFRMQCLTQVVTTMPDSTGYYFGSGNFIPYTYLPFESVYLGGTPSCVDCRIRGGNLLRPSYW